MYKMISCKVKRNFELFENWEEISNFLKTKKKFQTFWKLRRNFKLTSGFLFAIQRLLLWICQSVFLQSIFFNKKKVSNCIFLECTAAYSSSKLCEFILSGNYIDIFVYLQPKVLKALRVYFSRNYIDIFVYLQPESRFCRPCIQIVFYASLEMNIAKGK